MYLFISIFCSIFLASLENQLEKMVWKNRVVVLYCPNASEAEFKLQKKWLSEVGKDFMERDLQVIDCVELSLVVRRCPTSSKSLQLQAQSFLFLVDWKRRRNKTGER